MTERRNNDVEPGTIYFVDDFSAMKCRIVLCVVEEIANILISAPRRTGSSIEIRYADAIQDHIKASRERDDQARQK
jgi:hypothetical protein